MEDAAVGALCLLSLFVCLLLTDLEMKRTKDAADRERRRANRRSLRRQLVVGLVAEAERIAQRRRRRRQVLLRILAGRCPPCVWTHKRADEWWTTVVPAFHDRQWLQNFRMSRPTFEHVCRRLKPAMEKSDTSFRLSVPLAKRVGIALWKLANNAEYRRVAQLFGVGVSTACHCLRDFCAAVEEILLPDAIRVPDADEQRELTAQFERRWGLPQCIGAIGELHIPILAPRENRSYYLNADGWYSIVLQTVADGSGLFWSVHVGQLGSWCPARVLCSSPLWELAETCRLFSEEHRSVCGQEVGRYILGDAAHPLTDWLMTPFPDDDDDGGLSPQRVCYNRRTGRARAAAAGRALCRLKGRWRCVQERSDCSVERVASMVLTCCVLHNICERHGEEYSEEWGAPAPATPPEPDAPLSPPLPSSGETHVAGVREALTQYLST